MAEYLSTIELPDNATPGEVATALRVASKTIAEYLRNEHQGEIKVDELFDFTPKVTFQRIS